MRTDCTPFPAHSTSTRGRSTWARLTLFRSLRPQNKTWRQQWGHWCEEMSQPTLPPMKIFRIAYKLVPWLSPPPLQLFSFWSFSSYELSLCVASKNLTSRVNSFTLICSFILALSHITLASVHVQAQSRFVKFNTRDEWSELQARSQN